MPGYIQIMKNPDGGEDNKEAKWWKDWIGKKKEVSDRNNERLTELERSRMELHIQQNQTRLELALLCKQYDELVKQLAAEGRVATKTEHRRLEVDESEPSV